MSLRESYAHMGRYETAQVHWDVCSARTRPTATVALPTKAAGTDDDDGEEGEEESEEDDGEPEADGTDEAELEEMRQQAHTIEPRERLAKDRGFLCWDNAQRTAFFPLVLTENWSKGMRKIKCACLQPRGNGIYTVDPRWKGDSNKAADKATIALIFEVMGEGLRQMPDGFEGEPAWKLTTVRRQ